MHCSTQLALSTYQYPQNTLRGFGLEKVFGLVFMNTSSHLELVDHMKLENAFPAGNAVSAVVQSEFENIF